MSGLTRGIYARAEWLPLFKVLFTVSQNHFRNSFSPTFFISMREQLHCQYTLSHIAGHLQLILFFR